MFTTYECVTCDKEVSWANSASHTHNPVRKFIRFHVDFFLGVAGLAKPLSSLVLQVGREAKRGQRWEDQDRFMKRHAIPISLSSTATLVGSFVLVKILKGFGVGGGGGGVV